MKFYEVFKTGTYPQGKFTKKEIAVIAKNYDPKFCEAPVTISNQEKREYYLLIGISIGGLIKIKMRKHWMFCLKNSISIN